MVSYARGYAKRYHAKLTQRVFNRKAATRNMSARIKQVVKKMTNSTLEQKYLLVSGSPSIGTTAQVQSLLSPAAGDNENNREGIEVRPSKIEFRANIIANGLSTSTNTMLRIVFLRDKQQVADAAPTSLEIFGTATPSVQELPNWVNRHRFEILRDDTIRFGYVPTVDIDKSNLVYEFTMSLPKWLVQFNGTAGTDINKNGIYFLVYSNQNVNQPAMSYQSRISFTG